MGARVWKPHVEHALFAVLGLILFHVAAYLSDVFFPIALTEIILWATVAVAIPCIIASCLYSLSLQWFFPIFLRSYQGTKLFVLSGLAQGIVVYPLSVKLSGLLTSLSTPINLIGAVLLINAASLVIPIMIAVALKIRSGVSH